MKTLIAKHLLIATANDEDIYYLFSFCFALRNDVYFMPSIGSSLYILYTLQIEINPSRRQPDISYIVGDSGEGFGTFITDRSCEGLSPTTHAARMSWRTTQIHCAPPYIITQCSAVL